ncbi:lytic transglycosylase [Cedecea neteri]|uniref:Lytic transglycosylase n=1 Tax=Cedecea neteri TaxID=158822 RepID=A0A089Q3A7_9ENTR|nr:lytic transglycosylase domain-containing protein [Cedecea neteri]AIR07172.1 lytic transglycosylase [Cedecea neteri]
MSGSADTIKDFLVSLGFDIDNAGANKFEAVVKGVTANVLKLGATVEGAAASVLLFTTKIADGLDKLYWASQRTGATVAGIKALGYAASQTGGSAQAALSSLEGLASFMRNNPGAEGFLNRLGVQTRDASGKMRDTAAIFTGVGQKLNSMPYYRARQYAQMLGIDENTLQSMRRGLAGFTSDYQSMMQKTGFNADKAAQQSNKFMTSMRGLTGLLGILRDKIGSNLAGGLAGSLDSLRKRILDNFPKIEETLTRLIKGILWFADAFARMGYRLIQGAGAVIDWWKRLDDGSKSLLKVFGALLVAWRLLNSSFLMSPIGFITALIVGLALLWDDYQTWKEGGKSLIDWSKWQPDIELAKKAIVWIRDKLLELKDAVGGWQNVLAIAATFIAGAWLTKILGAFSKIAKIPGPPWLMALMAYGGYVASDHENITAAAESSWDYTKRNVGDALRWMGINTDLGRKNTMMGIPDAAYDIPGNFPDQQAQSVKRPQASAAGKRLLGWMGPLFSKLETLYQLPAGLLNSVATAESGGNQFAMSGAGAKGLFQFMDGTAKDMGLRGNDVFDPEKSAQAAAKYLSQLLRQNGGNLDKALASYNWGIGNVQRYGMGLMPAETRNYIPKVRSNMPGGGPQVQQETIINIHGVNDPREAARLTAEKQISVNAQTVQQLMVPR